VTSVIATSPESESDLRFEARPGKKLARPNLKKKAGVVVHACHPSYVGSISNRIKVVGKNTTLPEK
jgi:hypothetical protein